DRGLHDVAEADPLLQLGEVDVDRANRPAVELVDLAALGRVALGVDDREEAGRCAGALAGQAAVTVVVRAYDGGGDYGDRVAERLALLERGDQREDLRGGAGLHAVAAAVGAVDGVVDLVLTGALAV